MTLTTGDAPVAPAPVRTSDLRAPSLVPPAPALSVAASDRPASSGKQARRRPSPHSRRRAQARSVQVFLRTHAADIGLFLLAALCVVLVTFCLRG